MKSKAGLLGLIPIIYFAVSGGPYGLEEIVSSVGPFYTLLLILIVPLIWTVPEYMIVSELSSNYPVQGGFYRWVQLGMGKFWGFMEGWWKILYTLIDLSLYPILFTTYLKILFPDLTFLSMYLIQLFMIWFCVVINILGIRAVSKILTVFKFFIIILFFVFVFLGAKYVSFDFSPIFENSSNMSFNNLAFGLSLVFWNYIGLDGGSTVLGEIDNPSKNFYKGLLLTIPIIVLMYFFPILVGASIHTDWDSWRFGEYSYIAETMHMPILAIFLAIGGMVMAWGLFNSLILTSTRILSTMSEDKWLPEIFSETHKTYHTPYKTIIFAGIIFSILVLIGFHKLVVFDVFLFMLAMFLQLVALVVLRKDNKDAYNNKDTFKIPFGLTGLFLFVGLGFLVICFMSFIFVYESVANHDYYSIIISLLLVFSGIPIYYFLKSRIRD